ncbi:hypothetical protein AJ79_05507 [Helicocarpus griseus UAMH5409]|uniref:Berberine/berberine-like domain-containing protein n=1 Tax=Helicocarpus griseus UAMH5409 TaxID=1447875 RepID=A0A2B7XNC3_9EURO|nr:hypothetical protein AJ79_05507 [Helicocarpus griseus UAMH5409]
MLYRGVAEFPAVFHAFDGIIPVAVVVPAKNGTQHSAAVDFDIFGGKGKWQFDTTTVRPDADLYVEMQRIVREVAGDTTDVFSVYYQPITTAPVKKGHDNGGNSLRLVMENQTWLAIVSNSKGGADDTEMRLAALRFRTMIEKAAKERGLLLDFLYSNDASYKQSPLQGYGAESLAALQAASAKYDPQGVFQRLQNSGFLLSKVEASALEDLRHLPHGGQPSSRNISRMATQFEAADFQNQMSKLDSRKVILNVRRAK